MFLGYADDLNIAGIDKQNIACVDCRKSGSGIVHEREDTVNGGGKSSFLRERTPRIMMWEVLF